MKAGLDQPGPTVALVATSGEADTEPHAVVRRRAAGQFKQNRPRRWCGDRAAAGARAPESNLRRRISAPADLPDCASASALTSGAAAWRPCLADRPPLLDRLRAGSARTRRGRDHQRSVFGVGGERQRRCGRAERRVVEEDELTIFSAPSRRSRPTIGCARAVAGEHPGLVRVSAREQ
jgi:hypothetical protein